MQTFTLSQVSILLKRPTRSTVFRKRNKTIVPPIENQTVHQLQGFVITEKKFREEDSVLIILVEPQMLSFVNCLDAKLIQCGTLLFTWYKTFI